MGSGVVKSGSPIPREITSFIVAAISKNFRIPEGLNAAMRRERYWFAITSPFVSF
jgi:hypothetical protein